MRAVYLAFTVAMTTLQIAPPQQTGQRGQATTAEATRPAPLTAAQCKCSIEVTVKRSGTGEAISDVEVSLTSRNTAVIPGSFEDSRGQAAMRSRGSNPVTKTTDSSGRALFQDLAEGTYLVQAKREGYFGVSNDTYPDQATVSLTVGPANQSGRGEVKPLQQVTFDLVQGATIAGRIQDTNHRPVSAVRIGAYRVTYQNGHRVIALTGTAVQTDDRGEYRLFWFPPGEYYVRTANGGGSTGFAEYAGYLRDAARNGTVFTTSYYPGTADPKAALPVVVRDGGDLTGINFALQPSSGVSVSGTIVNTIPGGRAGRGGEVNRSVSSMYLVPSNPYFWETPELISISTATPAARGRTSLDDSERAFEIRGLSPGTYDFYPVFNSGPGVGAEGRGARPGYFSARTTIEVGTDNITGIQSIIRPGADLKGRVTAIDNPPTAVGGRPVQAVPLTNIRVQIQPKQNVPTLVRGPGSATAVDADGYFTLVNLIDAQYFISGISPLPADAYISEVRQDGRKLSDENIINIVNGAPSTLEIAISRGGGTIQGIVQDSKHNPVEAARITLIPDIPRRQNVLLYKTTATNALGGFYLDGLTPGIYKLFAWEHNPAGAEQNPEFIRDYEVLGVSVNVAQGLALSNIQVPLIPSKH